MIKMTAKERIKMAAMGKEPDRVPVCGVYNEWCWAQVYGRDSFMDYGLDPEKITKVMVWSCKEIGCDSTSVRTDLRMILEAIVEASGMTYPSTRWKDFVPANPHRLYEGDPIKEIAYGNPLIKTIKDVEKLKPADPYKHGRLPISLKTMELANKKLKGEYPVGASITTPLLEGGKLMGWTQMYMAMEKDIELWKKVEDVVIKTLYEFAKALIKAGASFLSSSSELPQKVGSKMYFEKPIWAQADHPPEVMQRIWNEFKVGVGLHPCTVGPFEPGIEAWKTMLDHTPSFLLPEYGGADALARAKEQLAPAMVMGNIHSVDVMLHGSRTDVEEACIELIKKCGPGGRYQLAPGCMLPLDTPYENVKTMIESAEKYGKYPIRL